MQKKKRSITIVIRHEDLPFLIFAGSFLLYIVAQLVRSALGLP